MKRRYALTGLGLITAVALISTAIAVPGGGTSPGTEPEATTAKPAATVAKKKKKSKPGPPGPQGQQGPPGVQGQPGPAGNGTAVWIHQINQTNAPAAVSFTAMSGTIATAGQYLVTAKIRLVNFDSGPPTPHSYLCTLRRMPGNAELDGTGSQTIQYLDGETIPLQGATTFAAGDTVLIECNNPTGVANDLIANQGSIIAKPFSYTEQALP